MSISAACVLECFSFSGIVCRSLYRGALFLGLYCFTGSPIVLSDRDGEEGGEGGLVPAVATPAASPPPGHTHTHKVELRSPGCECRPWMDQNHSSPTRAPLHRHAKIHTNTLKVVVRTDLRKRLGCK